MPESRPRLAARYRRPLAIFFTLFAAYGYFHQGGGWNQNSRFSQVRAVVEDATFSINDFCAFDTPATADLPPGVGFRRRDLPERVPADYELPGMNGFDISIFEGRIYPNKPPGVTLLARPVYALIHAVFAAGGVDPDAWWPMTMAFYLTTVFSIGLLGALGGVIFFALSRRLSPETAPRWHAAAALAFGLGTIYFPFATMLFDHIPAAVLSLMGFALALSSCEKKPEEGRSRALFLFTAGLVMGLGVLVSYTVVFMTVLLGIYLTLRLRPIHGFFFFVLGGALPAVFLFGYHTDAFGGPFVIANTHEFGLFLEEDHFLGVFAAPDPYAAFQLLFGTSRGLFLASPIFLLAIYGWFGLFRRRRLEAVFILAVFLVFYLMNASFNAWHSGNSFGPRYLLPALPFLALPLAPVLGRWPRLGAAAAVVSAVIVFLPTATDPMIPEKIDHPLYDFTLPGLRGAGLHGSDVEAWDPVSRNPTGVYELAPFRVSGPESREARWNAFNLGEFVLPHQTASLVPLVLVMVAGSALALAGRED